MSLTFAQPVWFWLLLLLVPLVLLRILGRGRAGRALEAWVPERLQETLVQRSRPALGWIAFGTQLLGLALLITALARPIYGEEEVDTETEGRNVILAVDTSRSMMAEDVEPNRLTRAALACQDLVSGLSGEQIGVIAFAGRAFLQAPLTNDHAAVLETIRQLDTYTIARGGTNIAEAIRIAQETFDKSGAASNGLIIFSDGDELEGEALEEAAKASDNGVCIITVGVGTEFGSIIPDPEAARRGGEAYVTDDSGNVVKSQLGVSTLRALADSANGFYFTLGGGELPMPQIRRVLDNLETQTQDGEARDIPIERYRWPLAFGLGFLILGQLLRSIRGGSRGSFGLGGGDFGAALPLIVGALFLSGLGDSAHADQVAETYRSRDYQGALDAYEKRLDEGWRSFQKPKLQLGRGAAAYQLGDFKTATEAFGEALRSSDEVVQSKAHYNLGNTLAKLGQAASDKLEKQKELYQTALDHYDSALELAPENPDAAYNRGVVQQMLDQVKPPEEQEQEEEKDQEEQDKEEQEQEDKEEQQQDQQDQEKEDQKEPQEPKEEQEDEDGRGRDEDNPQDKKENQEGSEPQEDQNQEPQDEEGGDESEQDGQGDEEQDQSSENQQGGEQQEQQDGGEQDQPQESEGQSAPEGDLEAQSGGASAGEDTGKESMQAQQNPDADDEENGETGFSRSRARALLKAFADEDLDVRPDQPRPTNESYKNW